jgi:hypothetical protein
MFDLTDVNFVKRVTVGSRDPESLRSDEEIDEAVKTLNRCLTELPRGKILGIEKSFSLLNIGEHQVVLQAMTYHVGFTRKPQWLDE